jgi:phosphoenolpyruvate synthase/pyruvate phosphate dikinase
MNLKELMEYLRTHEMDVQSARAMFLLAERVYRSYVNSSVVHGENYSPGILVFSADRFYQFFERALIERVARKVYNNFLKDKESLEELIASHRSYEFLMDELWGKLQTDLATADMETLKGYYSEFMFLAERWWHYAAIGEDKGWLVEKRLAPELAKRQGISEAEAVGVIGALSHPDELAMFTRERKEFYELCRLKLENDSGFRERVEEFAREYFWKDTDFYQRRAVDASSVIAEVEKETGNKNLAEIKRELEEMGKERETIKNTKRELREKFKLGREDDNIIEFAQLMTQWQDFRKLGMTKHLYYIFYLLEVLAERLEVKYEDLVYLTLDELDGLWAGKGTIDMEIVNRRKEGTVFVFVKDQPLIDLGKEAYQAVMEYIAEDMGSGKLTGTVASVGKDKLIKIEGKVRIIVNPLQEEFADGEILVTSMTRVEFVPLMRRAKAIITDEGGITTNAAIVSRELGVPCIIDTRQATRVLKNGDRVELDMESGIIKTIK